MVKVVKNDICEYCVSPQLEIVPGVNGQTVICKMAWWCEKAYKLGYEDGKEHNKMRIEDE